MEQTAIKRSNKKIAALIGIFIFAAFGSQYSLSNNSSPEIQQSNIQGVESSITPATTVTTPEVNSQPINTPNPTPTPNPYPIITPTLNPTIQPTIKPTNNPTNTPTTNGKSDPGSYINVDGNRVQSPTYSDTVPPGATAKCRDGTYSFSQNRKGTCSGHGGVAQWL